MLPINRVLSRLQGQPTDRVPFAPVTSLYGARLISCKLDEYYSQAAQYARGQDAIVEKFEPDILFSPFALVLEAEAFGSQIAWFDKNPPNLRVPAIEDYRGIASLQLPSPREKSGPQYILESTRLLAERYKDQIPVAAIVNSPTDLPALILGIENWIDTLFFHLEEARKMIELTTNWFVSFSNQLIEAGASCIIIPASFSNPTIITYQIAKDILVPEMRKAFSRINAPIIFHHGGARLLPFLELLHGLPNVAGMVIDPRDSFSDVRKVVGNKLSLMGNINGPLLLKANQKTIEEWCMNLLESQKNDPTYIMTTSNADIPYDTPMENLKTILSTVKNYYEG